ncbi:MAG TPA: hypothetical protein VFA07_03025 [Chthonomonadaceae bacterium]|nr:hypothetical protein [Chthonomonadaceae bacterium]
MSEQPANTEPDKRTDAQRFEDALRAPKAKVDAMIAEERAKRKKARKDSDTKL